MSAHDERELLAHAMRVAQHLLAPLVIEAHRREQFGGARARDGGAQPLRLAHEAQVLLAGQPLEQVQALGHHPDAALDLERRAHHVEAGDARATGVGASSPVSM